MYKHPRGQRSQAFLSTVPSKVTSSSLTACHSHEDKTHTWILSTNFSWPLKLTSQIADLTCHRSSIYQASQSLMPPPPYLLLGSCSLIPLSFSTSFQSSANPASCNFKIHPESNYSSPSSQLLSTYHAPTTITSLPMMVAIDSNQCMIPPPPTTEWCLCSRQNGPFKCKSFHVTFLLKAFYWLPTHSE